MVVGLTGGIGSGKTTVLDQFKSIGNLAVYNADIEAKKIMNTSLLIKQKIITHFGADSYVNNQLNRVFLAQKVFANKKELAVLNNIVHPEVYKHLKSFIANNKSKDYVIYENAILFENKSDTFCDVIITVYADEKTRVSRVMKRDNVTKEEVLHRVRHQMKDEKKRYLSNYIINNNGNQPTYNQIIKIHNILTKNKYLF